MKEYPTVYAVFEIESVEDYYSGNVEKFERLLALYSVRSAAVKHSKDLDHFLTPNVIKEFPVRDEPVWRGCPCKDC